MKSCWLRFIAHLCKYSNYVLTHVWDIKAVGAPTGASDQPACTFFFSLLVQPLPSSIKSLGSALLQCTLSEASVKQLSCEKKLGDAPSWASLCVPYTLWLQSHSWVHALAPSSWLSCTMGVPCLPRTLPVLTLLSWLDSLTWPWTPRGWSPCQRGPCAALLSAHLPLRGCTLAAQLVVLYWEDKRYLGSRYLSIKKAHFHCS